MSERMETARAAWAKHKGTDVPAWVQKLIEACDATSQNKVADKIGMSPAVVSNVIRATYGADTAQIEERVRMIFTVEAVPCPALGEISGEDCQKWRDLSKELVSGNPVTVRMFKACRKCPIAQRGAPKLVHDATKTDRPEEDAA